MDFFSSMNLKMHFEKRHGCLKPPELRIQRLIRHFKGQSNFIICFFSSFKLFDFLSHLAAPSSPSIFLSVTHESERATR